MGCAREPAELDDPLALAGSELEAATDAMVVVLWLASVARVWAALAAREVFGAEASVALGCAVALPWRALRGRCGRERMLDASRCRPYKAVQVSNSPNRRESVVIPLRRRR